MEIGYWQHRWDTGQIGFHEGQPNELLAAHARAFAGRRRVLVPLAGKSRDLVFLASLGLEVVGVEAVESACRDFFEDNAIPHASQERDGWRSFSGGGITLMCGDMFAATPEVLGTFDALYDRAALVALQPSTRTHYLLTLAKLLEPRACLMLVTFHYDQEKLPGPPFSIDPQLARLLYQGYSFDNVVTRAVAAGPKFLEAGVEQVFESLLVMHAP